MFTSVCEQVNASPEDGRKALPLPRDDKKYLKYSVIHPFNCCFQTNKQVNSTHFTPESDLRLGMSLQTEVNLRCVENDERKAGILTVQWPSDPGKRAVIKIAQGQPTFPVTYCQVEITSE